MKPLNKTEKIIALISVPIVSAIAATTIFSPTKISQEDITALTNSRDIFCNAKLQQGDSVFDDPLCAGMNIAPPSQTFMDYMAERAKEGCQEELYNESLGGEKAGIECQSPIKPGKDAIAVIERQDLRFMESIMKTSEKTLPGFKF